MTHSNPDKLKSIDWSCYVAAPAESLDLFDSLRATCPMAYSKQHDGFHMLLDWSGVRAAMSDYKTFSSQPQVLRPMLPRKPIPALEMDPPEHRLWRGIYNEAVRRMDVAAMDKFIRTRIRHHVADLQNSGSCDIVSGLCEPLPAEVICQLMGITDLQKVSDVRRAAIAMFAAQGDPETFGERQAEFGQITIAEIHARKAHPTHDFLSYLAGLEVGGRALDDEDYVVLLAAFLGAGHHSTTSAMASLVLEVFSRPDLRDRLKLHAERIPATVEEVLRLHPPFFGFFRRTTRDVSLYGINISEGTDVYCGWAAANRDPAIFEDPASFNIDRPNQRHMSFGFGIHSCPGAPLARMELTILLEELLSLLPTMELLEPAPPYSFGGGDYAYLPELKVRFTSQSAQESM